MLSSSMNCVCFCSFTVLDGGQVVVKEERPAACFSIPNKSQMKNHLP